MCGNIGIWTNFAFLLHAIIPYKDKFNDVQVPYSDKFLRGENLADFGLYRPKTKNYNEKSLIAKLNLRQNLSE